MKDNDLPLNWIWTEVGSVANLIRGITYSKTDAKNEPAQDFVPLLRANNIDGKINFDDLVYVPKRYISPEQYLLLGDIVIAMSSGSKHLVGKAARITDSITISSFGAFCGVIRASKKIENKYLGYFFQSKSYRDHISGLSKGSNINNLKRAHILDTKFPIAPLNEQKRIVDKIELLFSDLDEGEALLKTVRKQLATYRQSVLKAAVTGELTKDWREQNKHRLEPGDKLLERILKSRRENWKGRGKYKEPAAPDTTNLPDLPEGWVWASFEALITDSQNGMSKRRGDKGRAVDVLRLADIEDYRIKINDLRKIICDEREIERYRLHANDILCIRVNGSRELVGKFIPYESLDEDQLYCDHFIRFRTDSEFLSKYLCLFSMSHIARIFIGNKMVSTAGQNTISQNSLLQMPVALPVENEQQEILDRVAGLFSQVDVLENWCATELKRSSTMRQSILKAAFSGKLVPQDPSDEPAGELLKRIQASRAVSLATQPRLNPRKSRVEK